MPQEQVDIEGWIKLHRKILGSRIFVSAELFHFWCWCLLKASHSKQYVSVVSGRGIHVVELGPGQFIFGRFAAGKFLRIRPSTARNRLDLLRKWGNLDTKTDTRCTIVTICNWGTYQNTKDGAEDGKLTGNGQVMDSYLTANGQVEDTYKNDKKAKNVKKEECAPEISGLTLPNNPAVVEPLPSETVKAIAQVQTHMRKLRCGWALSWTTATANQLAAGVTVEEMLDISASDVSECKRAQKGKVWLNALLEVRNLRLQTKVSQPPRSPPNPEVSAEDRGKRQTTYAVVKAAWPLGDPIKRAKATSLVLAGKSVQEAIELAKG